MFKNKQLKCQEHWQTLLTIGGFTISISQKLPVSFTYKI